MRNPLRKRQPRQMRQEAGKLIALFLFLTATIGFVSGFLVADGSMKTAYDRSFSKYSVEDGHFTLAQKPDSALLKRLEAEDVTISKLFYRDRPLTDGHSIRVYANRELANMPCVMEGTLPVKENQIAIDRLYGKNNGISLGDHLTISGTRYTICGFIALPDYSALFKNNTDMMFDASKFTVALVTKTAFEHMGKAGLHDCYVWRNRDQSLTGQARKDKADDLQNLLMKTGQLTDFVARADNQAITFTGNDMGSDRTMVLALLYIIMVVLAFVFAVTTRSTIEQESAVIGTLRASGYTRGELVGHYLTLPTSVTLVASIIGNLIGYTAMKLVIASMYYRSYSLPTYTTRWNGQAFLLTTLIPCAIILLVNLVVLMAALSLPPLQFLRHDLKRRQKKRVLRLPGWKFMTRFRIRVILQNLPAYLTLFVGIVLASLLLMFGMVMSPLLSHFKGEVLDSQIARYQYVLKAPVETRNRDAEPYSVTALDTDSGEEITVYGIKPHSHYLNNLTLPKGKRSVVATQGYLEKYGLSVGDTITLRKPYENKSYAFTIAGSYHYAAALAIFLPQTAFDQTFDYDPGFFNGYFSRQKLTDLNSAAISSVITQSDLTVVADQLDDSMGNYFILIEGFAILLYLLLIYLLAKLIVERNAASISMVKILGYSNREAGSLYSSATAVVVVLSLCVSLPVCYGMMRVIYDVMMQKIKGWLTFYVAPWIYPAMLVSGILCYAVVHLLQMRGIRRIPLSQALKNRE